MPSPMEDRMGQMVEGKGDGKGKGEGKGFKGDFKGGKGFKGDGKGFKGGFKGDGKGGKGFKGEGKGFKGEGKGKGEEMAAFDKGKGKGKFKGGGQIQAQERIVYQRQSRNAGIHTIEIYTPQFWFEQTEMEEFDARPDRYGPSVIGKYTKGIGQIQGRLCSDDEDPVSFVMTAVHRLLERMDEKGFNETGRYQPDGIPLGVYHAVGRLDVGTESITDRSKSMKSYCMDIFERYGDGESNIEGVDQYNACYGGQACGLAVVSWVESDRWDGRYGIAVATDISEAHPFFIAFVGAACTATLFFPDAPMAHHSQRASAILHRLDFCKPVGWHDMAPVTDGKYSVECYLDALDCCYATLRKKVNDRELFAITDYNVFHTGGGYHIVKKAFERLLRNERPECRGAEREALTEERLHCSCHLLKRIGPCHTVSSFLNTASVAMSKMEQALGKVLMVFTYGSGCASSMYQLRFDDIPYFDPLEIWYLKKFYRTGIKIQPWEAIVHQPYVETWMKFDYKPHGRQKYGWSVDLLEEDVYYLGEIDKFGRRFYHRGGLKTLPIDNKWKLPVDVAEGRPNRRHWGPMHEKPPEKEKTAEDVRRQIEYDMTFDQAAEEQGYMEIADLSDTYLKQQKVTILKPLPDSKPQGTTIEPDGLPHTYQIVGTWNRRVPQEMQQNSDGSFSFEFTLGDNRWEEFYLTQDRNSSNRIYPHVEKGNKDAVPVGPHDGGASHFWLLDCRERVDVPEDQMGMPGDKYLVTFRWKKFKELTWLKLDGEAAEAEPGQYFIAGTWTDFEPVELSRDPKRRGGWYSTEVQMTSLGLEFKLLRNEDPTQLIYPLPAKPGDRTASQKSAIAGPDPFGKTFWKVDGVLGGVYKISYFRDPEDCEPAAMRVEWTKVDDRAVKELDPTFYLIGPFNDWGEKGMDKMRHPPGNFSVFSAEVAVEEMALDEKAPDKKKVLMPFKMVQHKMPTRCVHPDKDKCTQLMDHKVLMDDKGKDLSWLIGGHPADKAKKGDVFTVKLQIAPDGGMAVSWAKS